MFKNCKALTFDLFGTVLDLGGSLTPHLKIFLDGRGSYLDPAAMWQQLRYRQRIEQYQDTLVELGHSGYLETVQKAFVYVARANKLDPTSAQTDKFMSGWQELSPFPECVAGLDRLRARYKLIALSNGNPWFLDHLVKNRIKYDFDDVMSVEQAGYFKPKPGVYRRAARNLGMEPGELIMVSANSFAGGGPEWQSRFLHVLYGSAWVGLFRPPLSETTGQLAQHRGHGLQADGDNCSRDAGVCRACPKGGAPAVRVSGGIWLPRRLPRAIPSHGTGP